ncbi:MAG: hypothetical protein NT169_20385 [Chloroflexi bacterium]|nr:hypothetical protein [Chloroflexota bacterium]
MEFIGGIFLAMIAVFGVVGIVRGLGRELGVTIMLLIALSITEIIEELLPQQFNRLLTWVGIPVLAQNDTKTAIFCSILILMIFIAYQSEILTFSSKGKSNIYGLGAGLLNGYLFAGSLWYYLDKTGWPWLHVNALRIPEYYRLAVRYLPPHVFRWEYPIVLVVVLLIMRVRK